MPLLPVKVVCGCGQKYSFEVEPVNGRMPSTIACPVCHADGTTAANEIIARSQAVPPPPRPAPGLAPAPVPLTAARLPSAAAPAPVAPLAPIAPPPAAENGIQRLTRELKSRTDEPEADKWKWWYYVLAGICLGGYSIWQAYTQHRIKPLGELFLAVFCIIVGIWDFQRKRRKQP